MNTSPRHHVLPGWPLTQPPSICLLFCILLLGGCSSSSYLPSARETIQSPWESFDEVKAAFDQITPHQTSTKELQKMGFDPFITPNIELINYLDITQRFMPNQSIKLEDLDESLQECLVNREHCHAYEVNLHHSDQERYGNVILDIFNFRRKSKLTGWEFKAIIVLQNNLVTYKLWSGKPKIDENSDKKNPLGPLQHSESVVRYAIEN
ncbi:MAG: hypothetical protein OEL66_04770 [Desulfobulbaceae bacterium]|nr:hypothetical protein [Desulfobulbaceae bacterium]